MGDRTQAWVTGLDRDGTPVSIDRVVRPALWRRPPSWPTAASALLLLVFAAWAYSVPGTYFFQSILAEWLWIALLLVWLVRAVIAAVLARRSVKVPSWRWAVTPACGVAALAIVLTSASFYARYRVSRGAMDDAAAAVLSGQRAPGSISRIGLYHVEGVERIASGVRFIVSGTGFLDELGFAYSPHGSPTQIGEDTYTHLDGPWYVWEQSW